jgi:formate dehydrogenase subunit delta
MNGPDHPEHDGGERLVTMANDIGSYFRLIGRDEAIASIATHIQRYWTPRMRTKIAAYMDAGAAQLDELPRAALERLRQQSESRKPA